MCVKLCVSECNRYEVSVGVLLIKITTSSMCYISCKNRAAFARRVGMPFKQK